MAYTKGAVDEMLPLCTHILTAAKGCAPLRSKIRRTYTAFACTCRQSALRVLGFAMPHADASSSQTRMRMWNLI